MATKKVTKKARPATKPSRSPARTTKTKPKKTARKRATPKKKAHPAKKVASAKKKKKAGASTRRSPVVRKPAPKAAVKPAPKALKLRKGPKPKKGRAPKPSARTPTHKAVRRFDRPGHLDPKYAAELRAQSGKEEKDPRSFLGGPRSPNDDFAEELGEEVVEKATTGEDAGEESLDQVVPEEDGGPFVETTGGQEFAQGADLSNPKGAFREPFPTT
jgi:hypothetical protein